MKNIEPGKTVRRVSRDFYTHGRVGRVIELNGLRTRARVFWELESDETPLERPIRTWVRVSDLQQID